MYQLSLGTLHRPRFPAWDKPTMDQANFTREVLYIHLEKEFMHLATAAGATMALMVRQDEIALIQDKIKYHLREATMKRYLCWRRIGNTSNLEDVTETHED